MITSYICESCERGFKDLKKCKTHELKCKRANDLAHCLTNTSWKPYYGKYINFTGWLNKDKIELLRLVDYWIKHDS